ncbi:quinol oxidase subunit 4 [Bacillus sp. FJAT-18017]|uniref:cytochrome aa3 quinol oxidase subunit IV n=1 Tax=Bacillus sp. FJAT-18017 TaxID=1705566 RepID=UPI0006AFD598|nr:cytochrome aa3 quinol oxidase subunit IV [Bacillus sp. FJAT-18017]ALC90860.1 quinol oxidase subunit 4 [Bacillus sp. FJAT-18017]
MKNNTKSFPLSHVLGFLLSLVLTFGAAWIAIGTSLPVQTIMWFIGTLAVIQAAIQLYMFMHLTEGGNKVVNNINMMFSAFMIIVVVAGTIWVLTTGHSH